ncbi:PEP-CTERM sorting domain-containing protein [Rubripirellula tenax]|uniref:PEP-CTERM sorting domain-containing protein n=1 Tax=Rubripirellula tenax TaxID=2528015 RepID=UPI001FE394BB|nr:PEP-CTERM sorting domain-containing protein [Rubripirellula tenax]
MAIFAALVCLSPSFASADLIANFEFSGGSTEGWSVNTNNQISGLMANSGSLVGTATGNDPQLVLNPAGLTRIGTSWSEVTFRVRETDDVTDGFIGATGEPAFNTTGLIVQVNGTIVNSGFSFAASGDNFFTVTADISSLGDATISNFRIDPIGGAFSNSASETSGNFFEIDFIRVTDNAVAVPEVSSLAMMGIAAVGGAGMVWRRRKQRV